MASNNRYRRMPERPYRSEYAEYRRRSGGYRGLDPNDYRGRDPMEDERWERNGGIEPGRAAPNNYRSPRMGDTGDGSYRMSYDGRDSRRMIGFGNETMRAHKDGHSAMEYSHGGASSEKETPRLSKAEAEKWVHSMVHADDSGEGERWSFDKAKRMLEERDLDVDPVDWYAILNAVYADYCGVAMRYGLIGESEFFADLAEAWLCDDDAVENKAAMYYYCISK